MKQKCKEYMQLLNFSVVCSFLSSVSILTCIFVGLNEEADKIIRFIFPFIFWFCLIAEQALFWKANLIRKQIEISGEYRKIRAKPGIVSVSKTRNGAIADLLLLISLILLVLFVLTGLGEKVIQYILIFLLVLSFRLHCILNGKNFRYKKYLAKRKVDRSV